MGVKDVLRQRLVHEEAKLELKIRDDQWLEDRTLQLQQGMDAPEIRMPKAPDQPSDEERRRHNVTHYPFRSMVPVVRHGQGKRGSPPSGDTSS